MIARAKLSCGHRVMLLTEDADWQRYPALSGTHARVVGGNQDHSVPATGRVVCLGRSHNMQTPVVSYELEDGPMLDGPQ